MPPRVDRMAALRLAMTPKCRAADSPFLSRRVKPCRSNAVVIERISNRQSRSNARCGRGTRNTVPFKKIPGPHREARLTVESEGWLDSRMLFIALNRAMLFRPAGDCNDRPRFGPNNALCHSCV